MKTMKIVLIWLVFVLIDFALALLSLQIRDVWSLSSLIWFPGGIILGIVYALPPRQWPLWLVTGLLIHLIVSQWYDRPVNVSLLFAIDDLFTFTVSAMIWQFFYGVHYAPQRHYDVINLTLLCIAGGILKRFLGNLALCLFDYPTDMSISFPNVIGYVMSYMPLTIFVIYLITFGCCSKNIGKHCCVAVLAGLVVAALFFYPATATDEKSLLLAAVYFSLSIPLFLVALDDMRLLSGFLSVSIVGVIGATIFDYGPFPVLTPSRVERVQMASWYSVMLGLPTLLSACCWRLMTQTLCRHKAHYLLQNAVMEPDITNRFMLDPQGRLEWHRSTVWLSYGQAPVSWTQLMAWVHQEDRQTFSALKEVAVQKSPQPKMVCLRVADGDGGYHHVRVALVAHQLNDGKFIEGIIYGITQQQVLGEAR